MRFLCILLFSCFFIAPAQGIAAVHPDVPLIQETKSRLQENQINISATDPQSTALITSTNSSVLTLRPIVFPYTNFVHTTILLSNPTFTVDLKYVVCRYFYCKQIGLKLIFPEHYFW